MNQQEMTGAEIMIEALKREHVEVVFGIPGVQIMELLDAFYRMTEVRWITVRHEQTAAYMAFGYAYSTGKPGVAMVVPGPGALNTCAAIGTAYAASTPVTLLSGQIDTPNLGKDRGVLHDLSEQLEVFKPITKWNGRVSDIAEIPSTLHKAMSLSKAGRPRPVQIEIPFDLWAEKDEFRTDNFTPAAARTASPSKIRQAVKMLTEAERPVIWAGGGVIAADAAEPVTQLAERLNAAVVMTTEGKGALSGKHPLYAGLADPRTNDVLSRADVVLCLGSRLQSMHRWHSEVPAGLKVIQIDVDEGELGRNWKADLAAVADACEATSALLEELPGSGRSLWQAEEIREIHNSFVAKADELAPIQSNIIRDIRSELEEDAILVPGITSLGYWSWYLYPVYRPRTYLSSSYFFTLGYAFPTALGAKVGNPDRQVVVLSGDGGFLFAVGDLATAVQLDLNIVVIVFNDGLYGATYRIQKTQYDDRTIGTELVNPDYAALADSFGATGIKLSGPGELGPALRTALGARGPVVIEVPVENGPHPWEVLAR